MMSILVPLCVALNLFVNECASLGNRHVLSGDGLFAAKGVRHTPVVSRGPVLHGPFSSRSVSRARAEEIDDDFTVGYAEPPFAGKRAAVSGDVVGAAPALPASVATHYETGNSLLGESLGLVPTSTRGTSSSSRHPLSDMPGFPRFEPDGYIVHDQRGRDFPVCPPEGCVGPTALSPEMQMVYDRFKRYYRNYGPRPAAGAMARSADPLPLAAYERLPGGDGNHFTATTLLDRRANGVVGASPSYSNSIPGASIGRARSNNGDRVQLGGAPKARDSFFGKIYDNPDPAIIGSHRQFGDDIMYESASSISSRYGSASGRSGPSAHDDIA